MPNVKIGQVWRRREWPTNFMITEIGTDKMILTRLHYGELLKNSTLTLPIPKKKQDDFFSDF